ncbi:MAG TPA: ferritin family protein [Candidatus Cloacimonadota bacterium]|nr:ferritin family protein [Candidatus Cloacimonadota bacterium]
MNRKETYLLALEAEVRSQKLYHALAVSFRRPETSVVFQQLVKMEKNHEDKVRAAYLNEFPGADPVVDPQPGEYRHLNLKDPAAVLEYAMGREDVARDHYLILAEDTDEPGLKEMLLLFAREEEQHKEVLLTQLQDMQGALQWFDPSELAGLMED